MNLKSQLKKIPGLLPLYRFVFKYSTASKNDYDELSSKSNDELLSLMRHESHRIEKAVYNKILETKHSIYQQKWERLAVIYQILKERDYPENEPTLAWSRKIYDNFTNLDRDFIQKNSLPAQAFELKETQHFVTFLRSRRSVRVWAEEQPEPQVLREMAYHMIDAARWAPTSGNRQPWRFIILETLEEKELLRKIKEEHCISAPLLIFVGMDTRVYGALGSSERGVFIDAGAAIVQMVLLAHKCGLGVCWNHFAKDLIVSRKINQEIYDKFANKMGILDYIEPIAIIAIGVPKFIPPEPARMEVESLIIQQNRK